MGTKPGVRHYFAEGLTSRGYISLLPDMLDDWRYTYLLLGGPGTGKSTLLKMLGLELLDRGYEVDFIRSARDPDSMAGLFLQARGVAMLDALEVMPLRWRAPGLAEQFVDLSAFCDQRKLEAQRQAIMANVVRQAALQELVEEILIEEYGQRRPGTVSSGPAAEARWRPGSCRHLYPACPQSGPWPQAQRALKQLQQSRITPCFLHGLTPQGWLNLSPHFLTDCDQIRLEGEECLDALNWVLQEAQQLGQVIEIILHPLNPDEIIGIVFPQRKLAIWQGDPEILADQGLPPVLGNKLIEALVAWHNERALLKAIYTESMDFARVDELRDRLLSQILRSLEE